MRKVSGLKVIHSASTLMANGKQVNERLLLEYAPQVADINTINRREDGSSSEEL